MTTWMRPCGRPGPWLRARARERAQAARSFVLRNPVRTKSVPAEAERVAGGVEVHTKRVACYLARPHCMLRCSERKHAGLDRVYIVDGYVEVELLRPLTRRPRRRCEVVSLLER